MLQALPKLTAEKKKTGDAYAAQQAKFDVLDTKTLKSKMTYFKVPQITLRKAICYPSCGALPR